MSAQKGKFPFVYACCALTLLSAAISAGIFLGKRDVNLREENGRSLEWILKTGRQMEKLYDARVQSLTEWESQLLQLRLAEEERLRLEEEARKRQAEEEQQRLEEERKRQERENERAERARRAEEKRRNAASQAAEELETIIAEQEKAAAESNYRAQIDSSLKQQERQAEKENQEYLENPPDADVSLPIPLTLQKPELPNGCEVTALQMLLAYKGILVDKKVLAEEYLPQFPFYNVTIDGKNMRAGGDPDLYFAGNPQDNDNAYYCFAGPIITAANSVLIDAGSGLTAIDMTGTDEQGLTNLLDLEEPVLVWGTLSMGDVFTYAPNAWVIDEATGEKHIPFLNLHSVVLRGYDHTYFYLSDPLRGEVAVKRSTFMNAYRQIGMRAVVIR